MKNFSLSAAGLVSRPWKRKSKLWEEQKVIQNVGVSHKSVWLREQENVTYEPKNH